MLNAFEVSASEFISLLNGDMEGNKTYKVQEKIILSGTGAYLGNNAAVIAKGGIYIKDANALSLSSITVMGDIEIASDCRNVSICKCEIFGNIISAGRDCVIKANSAAGIALSEGSLNCLVAQNNVESEISVTGAHNCSVILNSTSRLVGCGNKNVYFIDNTVDDTVEMRNNEHIICDGNKFTSVISEGNTLCNGDTLCDVDARPTVGADESLLPHTDKDLYIGMERRATVLDINYSEACTLTAYIANEAKDNDVVIVPPGAYSVDSLLELNNDHSNTVIYAYGVYAEAVDWIKILQIKSITNLQLKGLTLGYAKPSAGQMQILDILGDNKFLCIASAGFMEKFGQLGPDVCTGGGYFFHPNQMYSWTEIGYWGGYAVIPNENGEQMNDDGTFVIEVTNRDPSFDFISNLQKGEILTCRLKAIKSDRTASISDSTDVLLKDTVTYGFSGGLCFVIGGTSKGIKFYRHHNLSHSGYEVDKNTFDKYKALEKKYDVDLEMWIDSLGRYRGSTPRIGSVDATHITGSSKGLDAISTLFENSCDDATNQNGNSSCLDKIIDNGDGTSTLILKDNIPWVYYWLYQRRGREELQPGHNTRVFANGNRIFAYAANGRVLCDTNVISDAEKLEDKRLILETDYELNGEAKHMTWYSSVYSVKVKTADLNLLALEGINPELADYKMDNKVIVDNISRNSADFIFDNCMVRHNRGRFVIKTHNATIKNCTFKDTSYAGIVMSCECTWGESSVPRNITVTQCLFDGASRTANQEKNTKYAAIAVEGLGSGDAEVSVSEDTLPAKNITVCNNVFKEVYNDYYVTFSAVQGVTVKDNVFEPRMREGENIPGAIFINGCMNVNVSGNTLWGEGSIVAKNYRALSGDDVEGKFAKDMLL